MEISRFVLAMLLFISFSCQSLSEDPEPRMEEEVFFLLLENIRTSPAQRLMEGSFKGRLFIRTPSGRIPENTPRVDVNGSFRVGIIGDVWQLSNSSRSELF